MSAKTIHHCHAIGCDKACPPERLMCARHWRMVPRAAQLAVWAAYRPGQCDDKKPSGAWMGAAKGAIGAVAAKEGRGEAFDAWVARQEKLAAALADLAGQIKGALPEGGPEARPASEPGGQPV